MFWYVVLFIIGLVLIIKGGDWFVDAASWIAEKSGIPKVVIGATIVSVATTIPEMVASILGTASGALGLAVGNAVGSVIANTGLILGFALLLAPMVINRKHYALKCSLLLIAVLVLEITLYTGGGSLNILEGLLLLVIVIAFLWENLVSAKRELNIVNDAINNNKEVLDEEIKEEIKALNEEKAIEEKKTNKNKEIVINILKFVFGAAGIYFGAKFLVDYGTKIAQYLNVSDAIIGLTLVAIGTSLPELVTMFSAIKKKEAAISIGNIIGANIIDISLILPVCAIVSGGTLQLESLRTIYLELPVLFLMLLIAFIPTLITKKFRRWQGISLLVIYTVYLVVIVGNFIQF